MIKFFGKTIDIHFSFTPNSGGRMLQGFKDAGVTSFVVGPSGCFKKLLCGEDFVINFYSILKCKI